MPHENSNHIGDSIADIVDRIGEVDDRITTLRALLMRMTHERNELVERVNTLIGGREEATLLGEKWSARVVVRRSVLFPTKKDDAAGADNLCCELRTIGLWAHVSALSYPRIKSAWLHPDGKVPGLHDALRPFAKETRTTTVRCMHRD